MGGDETIWLRTNIKKLTWYSRGDQGMDDCSFIKGVLKGCLCCSKRREGFPSPEEWRKVLRAGGGHLAEETLLVYPHRAAKALAWRTAENELWGVGVGWECTIINVLGKLCLQAGMSDPPTVLWTKLIFSLCLGHRDPRINLKEN